MDSFDVYYLGEAVGKAVVRREGLYCRVQCRCKKLDGIVRLAAGDMVIGVCIPQGDALVLEKSIPAKHLESCRFELVGSAEPRERFVPLDGPLPTECLRSLENARLVDRKGVKGLCY